jgi:hypothetical protein
LLAFRDLDEMVFEAPPADMESNLEVATLFKKKGRQGKSGHLTDPERRTSGACSKCESGSRNVDRPQKYIPEEQFAEQVGSPSSILNCKHDGR